MVLGSDPPLRTLYAGSLTPIHTKVICLKVIYLLLCEDTGTVTNWVVVGYGVLYNLISNRHHTVEDWGSWGPEGTKMYPTIFLVSLGGELLVRRTYT